VVDHVIPEPLGGAHRDLHQTAMRVKQYLTRSLRELIGLPVEKLLDGRYEKFRRMGVFLDDPTAVAKANGQGT
jgi:acetyl-CoA carboxylase carboxyl transferase subunit alpha